MKHSNVDVPLDPILILDAPADMATGRNTVHKSTVSDKSRPKTRPVGENQISMASENSYNKRNTDLAKINTVKEIKITRDSSYNDHRITNMFAVEG